MFKQAERNQIISKNPVPLEINPKGKARKERKVFIIEEQELFLKYAKSSYLYDFFLLALMTCMRNGELRALQWKDIDMSKRVINVNHTLIHIKEIGHILDSPKTSTSKREIAIIDKAYEVLLERYNIHNEGNIIRLNDDSFVFHLHDNSPITRDRVTLEINKYLRK